MAASSSLEGKVPVFVFPTSLDFYFDDQTTYKRVVTIYNPYDVDVHFKVLCNNPKKYAVVEPEGRISGQKCTDIVVRHVAISPQAVNQTDKFRIHMFEDGSSEVLGKRDILATLHPGVPDHSESSRPPAPGRPAIDSSLVQASGESENRLPTRELPQQPNYIACVAAIVCIAALFLPTEGEATLEDYPYLHLTVNQKLVFAYVLGLVTMAILRTT